MPSITVSDGLALAEGVVDRQGGDDEAQPQEQRRDDAVLQRHLARPEMADAAGQHPGHDDQRHERDDEGGRRALAASSSLVLPTAASHCLDRLM